jgi:hypothetical protein
MAPRNPGKTTASVLRFPKRSNLAEQQKILRISPEYQGLCLLYAHNALSRDKLYAVKVLCWARLANGADVALLPWLNGVSRSTELLDPDSGQAQGYYDPGSERRFSDIPDHHVAALDALCRNLAPQSKAVIQEIPDLIGSHAALADPKGTFLLEPVLSWQLDGNGELHGLIANMDKATQSPILAGDTCLYRVQEESNFRYFFQYHIANQIKAGGDLATRALSQLLL